MRILHRLIPAGAAILLALALPRSVPAANIVIINNDAAGEGFNDTHAATPVGGNPGTTIGAQRLFVFQYAASIWASILPSTVNIEILSEFNPLTCTSTSAVLGGATPLGYAYSATGVPLPNHWYHIALANKLSGVDNDPANPDIYIQFNSSIGTASCFPPGWYYGLDGNQGAATSLLSTVLHEMAHGLGFSTPTNKSTGAYRGSPLIPSVYDHFLYDNDTGLHWDQMTNSQRAASANTCTKLAWDGPGVVAFAPTFLGPKPLLRVSSPAVISGDYAVGLALFGPPLSTTPLTGDVVLAQPNDACTALTNAAAIAGNIALVDRGTCAFTIKVKNAQDAGAIGVIVVDNTAGCPPPDLGGTDATITIPSVRITQADGTLIKAQLGTGVNATLFRDPAQLAGADAAGRVLVYTPSTVASGSSVSHFDVSAYPNLLMEPFDTGDITTQVDLTRAQLYDIGWGNSLVGVQPSNPAGPAALQLEGNRPNPFGSSTTISFSLDRTQDVTLNVFDLSGRLVSRLHRGPLAAGAHSFPWNGQDLHGRNMPPGVYLYTLEAGGKRESKQMVLLR